MGGTRRREVEKIAEEVNQISLDYHLSHATFACDRLIQQRYKDFAKTKLKQISDDLRVALRRKDYEQIAKLSEEKASLDLKIKLRIFVEYVPGMDESAGRVVKTNNHVVINLPKKLLDKTIKADGTYDKEAVKTIRKLMAHELGHIALHVQDILEIDSTNGEKALRNAQAEEEAEWFAIRLLEIRHERNEVIRKDDIRDVF